MGTSAHQIFQVVVGPQYRMRRAEQQADHHHQIILGTGDRPGKVLIRSVVAVEESQLPLAVRRVVEGIDIEGDLRRRFVEGSDELVAEDVRKPP